MTAPPNVSTIAWKSILCTANGIDIHCLRTGGSSPTVVMLHGLMGSGVCWTPVARKLENDYDVIMPDARGHGDSSVPENGYRYEDLANDVIGLLDELGLANSILIGHSMGGMTAALVASRIPEKLRAVILVDPTFLSPERQMEVQASNVAEQHREALALSKAELVAKAKARSSHRSLEIIELQAEARLKTSLRAFDVLTPPNPDYRELVRNIKVPTLMVIGDNPVVTLDLALELREINPRMRIEQVEEAGHGLPFDQPDKLAEVITTFLRHVIVGDQLEND